MNSQTTNIWFIEMMGEPGSYDASVYDDFEDKDREGVWFQKRCQRRSKNTPLAGVKMYQFDGVGQSSLSAFSGAAVGCGAGRG